MFERVGMSFENQKLTLIDVRSKDKNLKIMLKQFHND